MLNAGNSITRYKSPFSVGTDPELRVDLVLRDQLAGEDMPGEQVVVHSLSDNLGHGSRIEFNETIVL